VGPGIYLAFGSVRSNQTKAKREEESKTMAKSEITGKRKLSAQNVSHSNIKTKRWQNINIQTRRIWVPELSKFISMKVTTRDIRTIDKVGVVAYAKRYGIKLV
jgi:large subunit ribosomal protein L28